MKADRQIRIEKIDTHFRGSLAEINKYVEDKEDISIDALNKDCQVRELLK